jgi:hypothetical protein
LQPIHRLVSVKKPIAGWDGNGGSLLPTSRDTIVLRGDLDRVALMAIESCLLYWKVAL